MRCSTAPTGNDSRSLLVPGQRLFRSYHRSFTRPTRSSVPVSAAFGFFRKKIATAGAIDDLLAAIDGTERGCKTSSSQRAKIDAAINVLEEAAEVGNDLSTDLTATWKLLWTTEKVLCLPREPPSRPSDAHHMDPPCTAGNVIHFA